MTTANITAHAISLDGIAGGAVDEAFQHELNKVIQNIRDLNTVSKGKRTLTISFAFTPNQARDFADVVITVKSSAGGNHNAPLETSIMINGSGSTVSASERFNEQPSLFAE